jgi:hypothetical protein
MAELKPTVFRISSYDKPEAIRFRKYATGTPLVLEGVGVETGGAAGAPLAGAAFGEGPLHALG